MTIGQIERLEALFDHMKKQEVFGFAVVRHDSGEITASYEFGREAPNSPMYGGASYGVGDTVDEALEGVYKDLRL
jgi:hypothetical protein